MTPWRPAETSLLWEGIKCSSRIGPGRTDTMPEEQKLWALLQVDNDRVSIKLKLSEMDLAPELETREGTVQEGMGTTQPS